ncbi:hypothetical protein AEQU1_01347 [Aequorivita sp. CIP111184]|nr:hypothetical protein AEQU1_01347 [Aequorivita sp. CIP111184]
MKVQIYEIIIGDALIRDVLISQFRNSWLEVLIH